MRATRLNEMSNYKKYYIDVDLKNHAINPRPAGT
jgi:hypothetical protein